MKTQIVSRRMEALLELTARAHPGFDKDATLNRAIEIGAYKAEDLLRLAIGEWILMHPKRRCRLLRAWLTLRPSAKHTRR